MSDEPRLVTIGRYWEPSEPLFLKSVLEGHGIDAFVAGEYLGNITGYLGVFGGNPHGGIELRVPSENAEEALEILNQEHDTDLDESSI